MEGPPAKKLRAPKKLRVLPICSEDCLEMAKSLPTTVSPTQKLQPREGCRGTPVPDLSSVWLVAGSVGFLLTLSVRAV